MFSVKGLKATNHELIIEFILFIPKERNYNKLSLVCGKSHNIHY